MCVYPPGVRVPPVDAAPEDAECDEGAPAEDPRTTSAAATSPV
ncbi:hypothetical protein CLV40_113125 [Actinokineospora auranticolor]|uniref:Uncharacterized protein n=1 Tax=Actinokineospora auranticolor TaxID=155976 RepID=A0A2S6GKG2_9PSEU|nr:hypothetical protein CLV40_113125 [Actinokineospora auranticolor]